MPVQDLSILIIDENRIRASIIEDGLREAGHARVAVIHDVNEVARTIEATMPDVVVIDLENPKRDTLEHFFSLSRAIAAPDRHVRRSLRRRRRSRTAVEAGVSAYVVDGLKKERVKPILDMADLALQRLLAPDARTGTGAQRARGPQGHRAGQGRS